MHILLRALFTLLLLAAPGPSFATSDGELAWTHVAFCNSAEICVTMASESGQGLDSLAITRKGLAIGNLPKPGKDLLYPLLQETRLVSVARADGGFENRLEVVFLDSAMRRFTYNVTFYRDTVYKTEVVAAVPAPV
jgi:hypothetical protein